MDRPILVAAVSFCLCLCAGTARAQSSSSWTTPARGGAPASITRSTGPGSNVYTYVGVPALRADSTAPLYRSPIPRYRHVKWREAPAKPARVSALKKSLDSRRKALAKSTRSRKTALRKTMQSRRTSLTGARRRTLY